MAAQSWRPVKAFVRLENGSVAGDGVPRVGEDLEEDRYPGRGCAEHSTMVSLQEDLSSVNSGAERRFRRLALALMAHSV